MLRNISKGSAIAEGRDRNLYDLERTGENGDLETREGNRSGRVRVWELIGN